MSGNRRVIPPAIPQSHSRASKCQGEEGTAPRTPIDSDNIPPVLDERSQLNGEARVLHHRRIKLRQEPPTRGINKKKK